jgi:serine protease AprX
MRSFPVTSQMSRVQRISAALIAAVMVVALIPAVQQVSTFIVPTGTALPSGARVVGSFPVADALLVTSPVAPAGAAPAATSLALQTLTDVHVDGMQLDSGVASTAADVVWADEVRGQGAVVALIDSGVAPIEALDGAIVGEIDFSGTGGGDGYGHGTFMASLIAADSAVAPGVAPEAGILSLKVGGDDGTTTLAAVLNAMQWLHGPGRHSGVRIATLALGVDPSSPAADMLDRAADRLAQADVLVITAAGNEGAGNLTSPATSTGTFSVGAFDDREQTETGPVLAAEFSGSGVDRAGVAQPDLLASGVSIVSHIDPQSAIYRDNPPESPDGTLFTGSGTSMSTALAAGVAALASSTRPDLGGTAVGLALSNDQGVLDAPSAVDAIKEPHGPNRGEGAGNTRAGNANVPPSSPPGQAAPGDGLDEDVWNGIRWTGIRWTGIRWTGIRWTGIRWTGIRWTGIRWTAAEWNGQGWGSPDWEYAQFGGIRWTGIRWTGIRWTGIRWTGDDWNGGEAFTGIRWTGIRWTGVRWTMVNAP